MGKASRRKRERSSGGSESKAVRTAASSSGRGSEGGQRKELEDTFGLDLSDFSDSEVNEIFIASNNGMFPPLIAKHKRQNGWSALHTAIAYKVKTAVSALVKAKVDINALDYKLISPVSQAVIYASPDYVELLIAAGADADIPDDHGATALMSAIAEDKADMVKTLLNCGADREYTDAKYRYTPMHLAAASKKEKSMRILFEAGVDLTKKDYQGRTAGELSGFIAELIEEKQAATLAAKHGISHGSSSGKGRGTL